MHRRQPIPESPAALENGGSMPNISAANGDSMGEIHAAGVVQDIEVQLAWYWYTLYALPLLTAANDSAQTAMGLSASSLAMMAAAAATQFVTSFATDSIIEIDEFLSTYLQLSTSQRTPMTRRNLAALGASGFIALGAIGYEATQAFYFIQSVPEDFKFEKPFYWIGIAGTITGAVALSGLPNIIYIYNSLSSATYNYKVKFNKHIPTAISAISNITGFILGTNSMLSATVGTATVLNVTPPNLYYLAAASAVSGYSNYTQNSATVRESLDEAIHTLRERDSHRPHLSEAAYFTISLSIASYLAYATQELAMELLSDAAKMTGITPNENTVKVAQAYASIVAIFNVLVTTICLFSLCNKVHKAATKPRGYQELRTDNPDPDNDNDDNVSVGTDGYPRAENEIDADVSDAPQFGDADDASVAFIPELTNSEASNSGRSSSHGMFGINPIMRTRTKSDSNLARNHENTGLRTISSP